MSVAVNRYEESLERASAFGRANGSIIRWKSVQARRRNSRAGRGRALDLTVRAWALVELGDHEAIDRLRA
jgi:hypothetical protein